MFDAQSTYGQNTKIPNGETVVKMFYT